MRNRIVLLGGAAGAALLGAVAFVAPSYAQTAAQNPSEVTATQQLNEQSLQQAEGGENDSATQHSPQNGYQNAPPEGETNGPYQEQQQGAYAGAAGYGSGSYDNGPAPAYGQQNGPESDRQQEQSSARAPDANADSGANGYNDGQGTYGAGQEPYGPRYQGPDEGEYPNNGSSAPPNGQYGPQDEHDVPQNGYAPQDQQGGDRQSANPQADYSSRVNQYQEQRQQYEEQRAQYEQDRDKYRDERYWYGHAISWYDQPQWNFAFPERTVSYDFDAPYVERLYLVAEPSQQLYRAPVLGPDGRWVGRIVDVKLDPGAAPSRVEIALNHRVTVWVPAGALRFDPDDHVAFSHLTRNQMWEMPDLSVSAAAI